MSSIDFTELFATITTATEDSWTTVDLTSLGVPDNAVVVVLMEHKTDGVAGTCGVREVGSSLDRYFALHEPEGGGSTSTVMHVQSNATASIQYYKDDSASVFTLLGWYGAGITYTEEMTLHEPTVAGWRETAVGQNNTVFEFSCQNITDGQTAGVGSRKVGSSINRFLEIHEPEPSGINSYTSYTQSDGSGNVELYTANAYGQLYRLGYFSSNIQMTEIIENAEPFSDGTWWEKTALADHENTVALISCMHQSTGSEELTGARGGASAVARYWSEHESETDQYTGDTLPVLVDSGGKYDTYFGDASDASFLCLGYLYDTGSAPAAVAPTSVLYGPLCGPLAGPI